MNDTRLNKGEINRKIIFGIKKEITSINKPNPQEIRKVKRRRNSNNKTRFRKIKEQGKNHFLITRNDIIEDVNILDVTITTESSNSEVSVQKTSVESKNNINLSNFKISSLKIPSFFNDKIVTRRSTFLYTSNTLLQPEKHVLIPHDFENKDLYVINNNSNNSSLFFPSQGFSTTNEEFNEDIFFNF